MDMTNDAAASGGERPPIAVHTASGDGNLSLRDAANAVRSWRRKGSPPERPSAPAAGPAAGARQTSGAQEMPGANAATVATPDRTEGHGHPDALSLRDLRERTGTDLRSDAPSRPAVREPYDAPYDNPRDDPRTDPAAPHPAVGREEAMRQQAEHALPAILHQLRSALAGEFADIRTDADAIRLAQTQPQRFARLQALTAQIAGVARDADAMQKRHGMQRSIDHYAARESARLKAHVPEMDDEAQWGRLRSSAVSMLKTLNYSDADLAGLWRGDKAISIHDHRFQRLLRDAVRWQELQSGEAAVLPDSAQAPRVVEIRSPESRARLRDLGETLENARGVNAVHAAATLLAERRKAARFR
jgi:hypothetical protein